MEKVWVYCYFRPCWLTGAEVSAHTLCILLKHVNVELEYGVRLRTHMSSDPEIRHSVDG